MNAHKVNILQAFRQMWRFIVAGILVTALHVVVATFMIKVLAASQPLANGVAFVIATIFSYTIHTLWSFSSRLQHKNLRRFLMVSALGCLLAVVVSAFAQHFNLHYLLGIALVTAVVTPVTFLLHRFWTYRESNE